MAVPLPKLAAGLVLPVVEDLTFESGGAAAARLAAIKVATTAGLKCMIVML